MIEVEFEDGTKEVVSHPRFQLIATKEKSDASQVRELLLKRLGSMMYSMLIEYDFRIAEVDPVLNRVAELVNNASVKSINELFKVNFSDERSLISINNILMENYGEKDNNGSSSNGEGTSGEDKK